MNNKMVMKGGSGTKCKPQYSERMHLSAPDEKAVSRICASKLRRNLQIFDWCLQFKQSYLQAFAILLLYAKTSREIIAIRVNLFTRFVSEKLSSIDSL
jgi:hypothetical protein